MLSLNADLRNNARSVNVYLFGILAFSTIYVYRKCLQNDNLIFVNNHESAFMTWS